MRCPFTAANPTNANSSGCKQGAQIVIGTPGRVMDHMRRGTLRLDKVKMVILDEVDVMLNMGFRDDIEFILQGDAQGTADGFLLRDHSAADPGIDRKICARPAERAHRAEGA